MTGITCNTKGVWNIDDVYKKTLSDYWITYDPSNDSGSVWLWGRNDAGQLGDNTTIHKSSPIQLPGTNWLKISSDLFVAAATKGDNTLWLWGCNGYGNLGDGTIIHRSSPVQVPGTSWCSIAQSRYHSLALKTDGTLWSWGSNNLNALGLPGISRSSPGQIPGTSWTQISAGSAHSLGLKSDATLWAWGRNAQGQLGNNRAVCPSSSYSPIQVTGSTWNDLATDGYAVFGRKTDGTLWAWGQGTTGHLGNNATLNFCSPITIPGNSWSCITASSGGAALKSDGTLWSWGLNSHGQHGNNAIGPPGYPNYGNTSSPVQVPGASWSKVRRGGSIRSTLAVKSDKTLWSWGWNTYGEVGDGTRIHRSSPVQIPGTCWGAINFSIARKFN